MDTDVRCVGLGRGTRTSACPARFHGIELEVCHVCHISQLFLVHAYTLPIPQPDHRNARYTARVPPNLRLRRTRRGRQTAESRPRPGRTRRHDHGRGIASQQGRLPPDSSPHRGKGRTDAYEISLFLFFFFFLERNLPFDCPTSAQTGLTDCTYLPTYSIQQALSRPWPRCSTAAAAPATRSSERPTSTRRTGSQATVRCTRRCGKGSWTHSGR